MIGIMKRKPERPGLPVTNFKLCLHYITLECVKFVLTLHPFSDRKMVTSLLNKLNKTEAEKQRYKAVFNNNEKSTYILSLNLLQKSK